MRILSVVETAIYVNDHDAAKDELIIPVDNPLVESRLHGLHQGDEIVFNADNILAVHDIHRHEIFAGMNVTDLKQLAQWLGNLSHFTQQE